MIKKIFAIILCVVVLFTFSLSAFASSYSTLVYENINSIQESFIASFLSHCGIEVEFFDWDIEYPGAEFKNAAWCNLTRNFANYVDKNDSKLSNKILEYASSCGLDSSIHSSSFVWNGSFKDSRTIVNQLVFHLYNFLSSYENVYGWVDVPISMYIGDYVDKFTGCYSRVTFLNVGGDLSSWYNSVGQAIQSYCTDNYVDDDFAECYINYYWDYDKLPLGYNLYLDVLEDYIDDYESPSGGNSGNTSSGNTSSGGSSSGNTSSGNTSSGNTSSGGSSSGNNSSGNFTEDTIIFSRTFYRPFFLGLLSYFDIDFCRQDFTFEDYAAEPNLLKSEMMPIIDHLYAVIMGNKSSYYISHYYPTIREDFLSICQNEFDRFTSLAPAFSFYPFDDSLGGFNRRFLLGFFELFCYEILDSSDFDKETELYNSDNSSLLFMFSMEVIDVEEDLRGTYEYWHDDYYYYPFIEFVVLCKNSITPMTIYKNIDSYFVNWYFDGDNLWYPYLDEFDFWESQIFYFPGYNIYHLLNYIVYTDADIENLQGFLSEFILNTSDVVFFVTRLVDSLPIPLMNVLFGGFVIVFSVIVFKLLI